MERCNQNYNPNLKAKKKKRKKFRMAAWRGSLTINVESQQKGVCIFGGGSKVVSNPMAMAGFLEKAKPEPAAKEWAEPAEGSPYSGRSQGGSSSGTGLRWRVSSVLLGLRWIPRPLSFPREQASEASVGEMSFAADHQNVKRKTYQRGADICYPGPSPFPVKPADGLRYRGALE